MMMAKWHNKQIGIFTGTSLLYELNMLTVITNERCNQKVWMLYSPTKNYWSLTCQLSECKLFLDTFSDIYFPPKLLLF